MSDDASIGTTEPMILDESPIAQTRSSPHLPLPQPMNEEELYDPSQPLSASPTATTITSRATLSTDERKENDQSTAHSSNNKNNDNSMNLTDSYPKSSSFGPDAANSLVPEPFARALRAQLKQAQHEQLILQQRKEHQEYITQHTWALLKSQQPKMAPPAPFKRIFSTGRAPPPMPIKKLNQITSTATSSSASNTKLTLPRFELAHGLSIQAIQASMDHTESGEMWCVRVQLQNMSSDRTFEQLKLSLAFDTTSSSTNCDGVTLTCHTQSIYLSPAKSTCLGIKLPNSTLPISWTEIPLRVHLSWFESKQWTELHPIALLRLSRWNPQPILLQPPTTSSLPPSSTPEHPLISVMDQVHRLDLSWRTKDDEEKSSSMMDIAEASSEEMKQLLTRQFALIQPDSSGSNLLTSNLRTMTEWICDSRSTELKKLKQSIVSTDLFLIRPQQSPTSESLTLHLAAHHQTITVFGPSPAALIRFFHQLKAALESHSIQLRMDPSSSLAQLVTRDLHATLERTLQTNIETIQKSMPAIAVEQLPTTPITLTPQQCVSYLHQTLPLQLHTPDLGTFIK